MKHRIARTAATLLALAAPAVLGTAALAADAFANSVKIV
jgi:hypothetical protein